VQEVRVKTDYSFCDFCILLRYHSYSTSSAGGESRVISSLRCQSARFAGHLELPTLRLPFSYPSSSKPGFAVDLLPPDADDFVSLLVTVVGEDEFPGELFLSVLLFLVILSKAFKFPFVRRALFEGLSKGSPQRWPNTYSNSIRRVPDSNIRKLQILTNIQILFANICTKIETMKLFPTINLIRVNFNITAALILTLL
jgi:hypothetical protein